MLVRKYQWMGMISAILTLLLLADPLMVRATEVGTVTGDGTTEDVEQYTVDDDEIWALIDRDKLRSLIDVDALKEQIDLEAYRDRIDEEELLSQISDISLLESMSAEEILKDYNSLKESGELDQLIKDVVESEEFDEDFIKNHPVDVPNVKVPIISGESPLDYILDPMELVYQTQAVRYGGGNVQEGANVLFRNSDGEYLFSNTSDMFDIVNKSNVPLQVTISARIENADDVRMVDSSSMLVGDEPSLFMALVGNEGIISVMNETGSSEVTVVLKAVPEGTYTYKLNEETGKYESEISKDADESTFDSFSFGVTGECNSEADWSDVYNLPRISVTWKTEPILTDWDKVTEELEENDKVKFEAFKKVKLQELRDKELERLVQIRIDDMIYEEMDDLIEEEVERLAQIRFEELKELAVKGELDLESGELLVIDDEDEEAEDAEGAGEGEQGDTVNLDEISETGEGSGDADGAESDAIGAEDKGSVLGATRERIEFIESDDNNVAEAGWTSETGDSPEFFDSSDSQPQPENTESSEQSEQSDEPVIFIDEEKKNESVIIF